MEVKRKQIIHRVCGKAHVDKGFFADFNHFKHKCEHCGKYFYDKEKAVGAPQQSEARVENKGKQ